MRISDWSSDVALPILLEGFTIPVVIKADGLAAGKGVIIAETREAAAAAIDDMFAGAFGGAGAEVVIEEFLTGEEASFFALTDGGHVVAFGSAQDHKRSEEHTSELQSLMRISYAVFCLKKKNKPINT